MGYRHEVYDSAGLAKNNMTCYGCSVEIQNKAGFNKGENIKELSIATFRIAGRSSGQVATCL